MRRRLAITHRLPVTEAIDAGSVGLEARERLAVSPRRRWWWPWAWAAAVLLHVAALVLFFLIARLKPPMEEAQSPPGVSVVFQNGGAQATAAPQVPLRGPSTPAQTPPPPPPPPQTAQAEPEVNLNMPPLPFAQVQSAPPAPPQRRPAPREVRRFAPPQHYVVMNGMSYGNPAPPMPNAQQAMNLSLPMSDAQAVNAPELTIKGDIGADWEAELSKWVNEHKYYPQAAAEQGQQGESQIEFTVDRAGNVTGLRLLSSSGSTFLDQAWLGLFQDNTLPPFPPGTKADHITVDATMHFELIQ